MNAWCAECGDEYYPVEYHPSSLDLDEPDFCSDGCEERYLGELDDSNRVDHMR